MKEKNYWRKHPDEYLIWLKAKYSNRDYLPPLPIDVNKRLPDLPVVIPNDIIDSNIISEIISLKPQYAKLKIGIDKVRNSILLAIFEENYFSVYNPQIIKDYFKEDYFKSLNNERIKIIEDLWSKRLDLNDTFIEQLLEITNIDSLDNSFIALTSTIPLIHNKYNKLIFKLLLIIFKPSLINIFSIFLIINISEFIGISWFLSLISDYLLTNHIFSNYFIIDMTIQEYDEYINSLDKNFKTNNSFED